MGRSKRKKPQKTEAHTSVETEAVTVEDTVLPESPSETEPSKPLETRKFEEDPRYAVLKDTLKTLVDASPAFDEVKRNPWSYLEFRNSIARLVQ
jgi:hypothetical protein